jgi:hypothetical protein
MNECFYFQKSRYFGAVNKRKQLIQKKKKKEIGRVILTLFSSDGNPPVKIGDRKIEKLVWYSVGNNQ